MGAPINFIGEDGRRSNFVGAKSGAQLWTCEA